MQSDINRAITLMIQECPAAAHIIQAELKKRVEVVRCKDCKHWDKETGWCTEHSSFIDERGVFCHPWESANWKMFEDNDFCSYGERKENE